MHPCQSQSLWSKLEKKLRRINTYSCLPSLVPSRNMLKYFIIIFSFFIFTIPNAQANPLKNLMQHAQAAYDQKDYDKAISIFEKAIQVNPNIPHMYYFLALSYREKGADVKKLKIILNQALKIKNDYAPAYDELSKIHYGLAEFDLAKDYARKAVEIDPNRFSSYLTLAWIELLAERSPHLAIPHFQRVLTKANIPYAQFGLGLAYVMDDQRPMVLEAVTGLRNAGADDLAQRLESVAATGEYEDILDSITPRPKSTQKVDQIKIEEHVYEENKDMKVRLSDKPIDLRQSNAPSQHLQDPISPSEQIRELRRRSMEYDAGGTPALGY